MVPRAESSPQNRSFSTFSLFPLRVSRGECCSIFSILNFRYSIFDFDFLLDHLFILFRFGGGNLRFLDDGMKSNRSGKGGPP